MKDERNHDEDVVINGRRYSYISPNYYYRYASIEKGKPYANSQRILYRITRHGGKIRIEKCRKIFKSLPQILLAIEELNIEKWNKKLQKNKE